MGKKREIDCNLHVATFLANPKKLNGEYDTFPPPGPLGLTEGQYEFRYDYPLSTTAKFKHKLNGKTSGRNILRYAAKDYKKIYDIEDGKVGNPGHIPGMLNRASSNGPFGIWGHDMGDLFFEGITIDEVKKVISFGIGS